jgi:YbbR domain-containing protein
MLHSLSAKLRQNLGLKAIAFLAAAGLWLYVMNTENPIRRETHARPVVAVNTPSGLGVARLRPESLKVSFTGRLSGLSRAQLDGVRIVADLAAARAGRNEVPVHAQGLPDRVTVSSMERATVQVWLEPIVTRQVPIGVVCTGEAAEGCALSVTPDAQPKAAAISGPETLVARVTRVVARVDLTGLGTSQTLEVAPVARDTDGEQVTGVQLLPDKVRVTVVVVAASSREVPVRARTGNLTAGRRIVDMSVSPAEVELRGTPNALDSITEVETERLDVRHLEGAREYRVALRLPSGTWLPEGDHTVTVRVTVGPDRGAAPPRRQPPGVAKGQAADQREPATGEAAEPRGEPVPEPPTEVAPAQSPPATPKPAGSRPAPSGAPDGDDRRPDSSREEVRHPEETP